MESKSGGQELAPESKRYGAVSPDELRMRLRGRESSLSPRAVEKLSREGESRLSISIVLI